MVIEHSKHRKRDNRCYNPDISLKCKMYLSQSMALDELLLDSVKCAFRDIGMAIFMWSTWQSNRHQGPWFCSTSRKWQHSILQNYWIRPMPKGKCPKENRNQTTQAGIWVSLTNTCHENG